MKVCHLTTAHWRNDIRIFRKECTSLAAAGFDVSMIVADGKGNSREAGVQWLDIGKPGGRPGRLLVYPWKCFFKARALKANLYHFHDPELLFCGLALKMLGARVIYDSHEMMGRQIRQKYYLPAPLRNTISRLFLFLEEGIAQRLDAVVVPQEYLMVEQFQRLGTRTEVVANYVSLSENPDFELKPVLSGKTPIKLLYSGTINFQRGVGNMLDLIAALDERYQLIIAGKFNGPRDFELAQQHVGWAKVDFRGLLEKDELNAVYHECDIGLIMFNPVGQYADATSPLKLFEYLLFGLPVITPDFGSWPGFAERYGVTFPVAVEDTPAQAAIVNRLSSDTELQQTVSRKAREVVEQAYNWEQESQTLITLYKELLG